MAPRGVRVVGKKGASRCPACKSVHIEYQGTDDAGNQQWRCRECGQRFSFKPSEVKSA